MLLADDYFQYWRMVVNLFKISPPQIVLFHKAEYFTVVFMSYISGVFCFPYGKILNYESTLDCVQGLIYTR
jgi:hypothetical protein